MQFYKKPHKNTYMFACDDNFFRNHGVNCLKSAIQTDNNIHCHILNPSSKTHTILQDISNSEFVSVSFSEENNQQKLNKEHYAKIRFYIVNDLIDYCSKLAIIDADSIFIKRAMQIFEYDLGVYERNLTDPSEKVRVLAGFLLVSNKCIEFIDILKQEQQKLGTFWYSDQIALARSIIKYKTSKEFEKIKYIKIPKQYIDWQFKEDSYIWSGKGERKHTDVKYLKVKERYD